MSEMSSTTAISRGWDQDVKHGCNKSEIRLPSMLNLRNCAVICFGNKAQLPLSLIAPPISSCTEENVERFKVSVLVTSNGANEKGSAIAIVHLARRRACRGGHSLADTSFLQLSGCSSLVLDGTKGLQASTSGQGDQE